MKKEELDKILELHKKWLNDERCGVKADLRGANLQGANLRYADLQDANLQGANLRYAEEQRTAAKEQKTLTEADLT